MSFKCAHFADIHFRGLSRHEEYKEVFSDIFTQLKKENLDAIFVGGDIVHSKTQGISPELIEILVWWFEGLADIARVYVILGNHDGLILNKDRQDAISPIIKALNNDNIVSPICLEVKDTELKAKMPLELASMVWQANSSRSLAKASVMSTRRFRNAWQGAFVPAQSCPTRRGRQGGSGATASEW